MAAGSHIGPPQAVQIFERLGASTAIPIHWGTFRLSYEAYDTPPKLLDAAMRGSKARAGARFAAIKLGQPVSIGPVMARPVSGQTDDATRRPGLDTPQVRRLR